MIEGNRIKFGYGDVITSVLPGSGAITFYETEEKWDILAEISDVKLSDFRIKAKIVCQDVEPLGLYKVIRTVTESNNVVEYNGIIFDFTNYSKNVVDYIRERAFDMISLKDLAYVQRTSLNSEKF